MIPKIIHYCWLSDDPVPQELQRYMTTWHKFMPDYEFIKWDFSRFNINSSPWVREAFENKKYAFAADFIRMHALYTMGGIYMDMDVEVLKSFDDLLKFPYFVCWENHSDSQVPEMATMGVEKGCWWIKILLDYYRNRHFIKSDGTFDTIILPKIAINELSRLGISIDSINRNDMELSQHAGGCNSCIKLLPCDFFSPKSYETGEIFVTSNTYSIHQFSGSWIPWEQRLEHKIWLKLGLHPHRFLWHIDKWLYRLLQIRR